LHELSRTDGRFLDIYAAMGDGELRERALAWAREQGVIQERRMWRAWWFDDELVDWVSVMSPTREEALAEVMDGALIDEPNDLAAPGGHEAVEPVLVMVGTAKLNARIGWSRSDDRDMTDMALMLWAREVLPVEYGVVLAGVWWRERYDPAGLSAPRGGIFPERLADWERTHLDWASAPMEREEVPKAAWIAGNMAGRMQKDGSVMLQGVRWVKPSPEWVARHGGPVYCSCCRAEGEKSPGFVPTDRKSISHRRAFAACEVHLPLMAERLAKQYELDRRESLYQTEAELQIFR
jgi:hypothetical protein